MEKSIELFLAYLKSQEFSNNTISSYRKDITCFINYCKTNNIYELSNVKERDIRNYLNSRKVANMSNSSINRNISSLRSYFNYLISIKMIKNNPVRRLKIEKDRNRIPEILNKQEIVNLLSIIQNDTYKGKRDRAIIELLVSTGIKVSELISLKSNDVNLQFGIITINSNQNQRTMPISTSLSATLNDYKNSSRNIKYNDGDLLFTNMRGEPISRQGIWKIIKFYANEAGIEKEINLNTLRHTFAIQLIENGADANYLKEMLGHKDSSSIQIYNSIIRRKYTNKYFSYTQVKKNN